MLLLTNVLYNSVPIEEQVRHMRSCILFNPLGQEQLIDIVFYPDNLLFMLADTRFSLSRSNPKTLSNSFMIALMHLNTCSTLTKTALMI